MRRVATTLAALAAVTALAACSTTTAGTGGGSAQSTAAPPSTTAPVSPPASTPVSSPSPPPVSSTAPPSTGSSTPIPDDVKAVLLVPSEVGAGFVSAGSTPPSALPCTPKQPPVTQQVHNTELGDTVLVNQAQGLQVEETVYVYASVADAVRHQHIDEKGLACSTGTLPDGTKLAINGPTDVSSQLTPHPDVAEGWVVSDPTLKGSLLVVRLHAVVAEMSFLAKAGTNPTLSIQKVVETALAKIVRGH